MKQPAARPRGRPTGDKPALTPAERSANRRAREAALLSQAARFLLAFPTGTKQHDCGAQLKKVGDRRK